MTGRGWCGSNSFTGGLCLFLDSNLATIVSAGRAYSVIDMKLSTVGAYCQCRRNCFVVGSSFKGPCLGLSSLWMCHFFVYIHFTNKIRTFDGSEESIVKCNKSVKAFETSALVCAVLNSYVVTQVVNWACKFKQIEMEVLPFLTSCMGSVFLFIPFLFKN